MSNNSEVKIEKPEIISWSRFWVELWNLLKSFKKSFGFIALTTVLMSALELVNPYILKVVIDSLTSFDTSQVWFILQLIILYFAAGQSHALINYLNNRHILRLLVRVEYFLGVKAQKKLVYLGLNYHEKENTGSKIVKIERGIDRVSSFLTNMFFEVFPTLIQLTFTLAALFYVDYRIGGAFLFFAPLYILVTYRANKKLHPVRKNIFKDYERASGKMGQAIININTVQSFVQEERELNEFDIIKNEVRENEIKQWDWMTKIGFGRNLIVDTGRVAVLFLGVYLVYNNLMSIGTLIFVFTLSERSYSSLDRLSRFYDRMEEGREGVTRLLTLFNTKSEIENDPGAYKPKNIQGEIEFKNVSFCYDGNHNPAVNKLNFKINSGCVTALVGPSGGGKTTVARLIYRHYDPSSGQVFLDDKNLKDYDLYAFRKFFAIVPQEVEIFDLSVYDNIAYSQPKASKKEVQAAARIANAEEFIVKLPSGYNTTVGERGVKLSGGQRQRIGIARAILANPRVLIFDEATSSLDSQSEILIQDAMEKISRDRTMIIIAHRLSTIKKADKIIVLEDGLVVEDGSHLELAQINGGLYAKLLKLQNLGDIK